MRTLILSTSYYPISTSRVCHQDVRITKIRISRKHERKSVHLLLQSPELAHVRHMPIYILGILIEYVCLQDRGTDISMSNAAGAAGL